MRYALVIVLLFMSASPVYALDDQEQNVAHCPVYAWSLQASVYDSAVLAGEESRTWFFGPSIADPITEPYTEDGYTDRIVAYWEKGRWECTPAITEGESGEWYPALTLGRLATELMTGQVQISHTEFEDLEPSEVHVAGDPGAEVGPTYRTMGQSTDEPAREVGTIISETIDRDGTIGSDERFAAYDVTAGYYIPETDHTIADVFWEFMTGTYLHSRYPVAGYEERDFYPFSIEMIGLPETEAYWTTVPVAGEMTDVLVQCFERRCLTYTPSNPSGWEVEMANIGMHYYEWRYGQ